MIDKRKITDLVENKIKDTDQFLVEVKVSNKIIAIFVDKPTGITIDECAAISRYVYNELDASGVLQSHEMEVSSPGMDQPLKVFKQYLRRIGKAIKVTDLQGLEYNGQLKSADENGFVMTDERTIKQGKKKVELKEEKQFEYSQIKETKLIFKF